MTTQQWIHWLEVGRGARWVRLGAILLGTLVVSVVVAWKQFHGPGTELTLLQADLGRQVAAGAGCTTLVNYPQTAAFLAARGVRYDAGRPFPELTQAPLYAWVIAGGLRLVPATRRAQLFASPPVPPDGFAADYFLLGLNLVLFWLALWLTYGLARRLFGVNEAWLATLALLASVPIWQQTVAVNGTPLLMVVALVTFHLWWRVESAATWRAAVVPLALLGAACGALFLAEYSAGTLVLLAAAAAWRGRAGRERAWAVAIVLGGFALVATPWVARNLALTGLPVALAGQNLALKAGDASAEPTLVHATFSAVLPSVDLNKLGNKTLASIQDTLKSRLWSGGALWLSAFFVAGWLYPFRAAPVNRLRWLFVMALGLLVAAQAALNSGDSERLATTWLSPLILIFGAGFFFVLLSSHPRLAAWPRASAVAVLTLQALPLLHDALEPRRLHFQYPPYFPALFQGMEHELVRRGAAGRYGLMADVPAGLVWYGGMRAWAQPPKLHDFYAIAVEQPIGELLLTPRTLDRPFLSDLSAKARVPSVLIPNAPRVGEWGEIYASLLTGTLPAEFPLSASERVADNLYVLINPALRAEAGK